MWVTKVTQCNPPVRAELSCAIIGLRAGVAGYTVPGEEDGGARVSQQAGVFVRPVCQTCEV